MLRYSLPCAINTTHVCHNTFTMASLKTDKISLPKDFQIEIVPGWFLDIDIQSNPVKYTLTHGKKAKTFHSDIHKDLCSRNYGIRLAKGRRQMILPPSVLQAFADHETFLRWYDPSLANQQEVYDHVTFNQSQSSS